MKRFVIILLALVPLAAAAQNKAIETLAAKYSGKKGFSTIVLKGELIKMADKMGLDIPKIVDISEIMDGISSIIIVGSEKPDPQFVKDVKAAIDRDRYKTLMSVHADGQVVEALIVDLPQNKLQKELVLIALTEENNVLVSIEGNYKIKKVSKPQKQ